MVALRSGGRVAQQIQPVEKGEIGRPNYACSLKSERKCMVYYELRS